MQSLSGKEFSAQEWRNVKMDNNEDGDAGKTKRKKNKKDSLKGHSDALMLQGDIDALTLQGDIDATD